MTERDTGLLPKGASARPHWTWWLMTAGAFLIAAYAFAYVVIGPRMYPPDLSASFRARPWGIYTHALFGGLGLLLGPLQFHRGLLIRRRALHRTLGQGYVTAAALTGLAGLYMSLFAGGGVMARIGFAGLAVCLLVSTAQALTAIRARRVNVHREWMLRSYALLFGAVTLRIELPLLLMAFQAFEPAYQVVAWLSWVPNLAWAEWHLRRTRSQGLDTLVSPP